MKKNSLFLFDLSIVLLVLSFLNLSLGQAKPPQNRPQIDKSRPQIDKSRPQLAKKQKQVNKKKSFHQKLKSTKKSRPKPQAWSTITTPSKNPSQAVGGYSYGCILGAKTVPAKGKGFISIRRERNRYYGHPDVLNVIENIGEAVDRSKLMPIEIGDLSQAVGGLMPYGHRSHQIGLDIDIWFGLSKQKEAEITQSDFESKHPSLVDRKSEAINENVWDDQRHLLLLKTASEQKAVNRIFVHWGIKHHLCHLYQTALGNLTDEHLAHDQDGLNQVYERSKKELNKEMKDAEKEGNEEGNEEGDEDGSDEDGSDEDGSDEDGSDVGGDVGGDSADENNHLNVNQSNQSNQSNQALSNPKIKTKSEKEKIDETWQWIAKIRPWFGHDQHFHIRLSCPQDSPLCEGQGKIKDIGCDEEELKKFSYRYRPPKPEPQTENSAVDQNKPKKTPAEIAEKMRKIKEAQDQWNKQRDLVNQTCLSALPKTKIQEKQNKAKHKNKIQGTPKNLKKSKNK